MKLLGKHRQLKVDDADLHLESNRSLYSSNRW